MDAFRRAETLASRPDAETLHLIGELLLRNGEHQRSMMAAAVQQSSANGNRTTAADKAAQPDELIGSQISEAKEYFIKAIQNDARMVESFRKLSRIYEHEADHAKAIEMLESIVRCIQNCAHADDHNVKRKICFQDCTRECRNSDGAGLPVSEAERFEERIRSSVPSNAAERTVQPCAVGAGRDHAVEGGC